MSDTSYRVADLDQNAPTGFDLSPSAKDRETLAAEMNILGIRKLRFEGAIRASGKRDWEVSGKLGATVVQTCVVTLDPVVTRIDVPVTRFFIAGLEMPDEEEAEMPEDDASEPLGTHIDVGDIMAEALAMELPMYPRKDGAALEESNFTEPGQVAMTDEDARPFAGLASLRDQLKDQE